MNIICLEIILREIFRMNGRFYGRHCVAERNERLRPRRHRQIATSGYVTVNRTGLMPASQSPLKPKANCYTLLLHILKMGRQKIPEIRHFCEKSADPSGPTTLRFDVRATGGRCGNWCLMLSVQLSFAS